MSKRRTGFLPRCAPERCMILDHEKEHRSRWAAVPSIAPSTYHDHVAKWRDPSRLSARVKRDEELKVEVWRVFEENFRVYGMRKVWRRLRREGSDGTLR